jgi:hypothetical protein
MLLAEHQLELLSPLRISARRAVLPSVRSSPVRLLRRRMGAFAGSVSHPQIAIATENPQGATPTAAHFVWLAFQRGLGIAVTEAADTLAPTAVAGLPAPTVTPFGAIGRDLAGSSGGFLPSIAVGAAGPAVVVSFQKSLGKNGTAIYQASASNWTVVKFGPASFVSKTNVVDRESIPAQPGFGIDAGAHVAIPPSPVAADLAVSLDQQQLEANPSVKLVFPDGTNVGSAFVGRAVTFAVVFSDSPHSDFNVRDSARSTIA